ncbi:aromatic amino acid ammonia-lyase [Flavisphingomonas formosensis]|uniref:aromatic amino acid ammonia-lyase n=1 Tax=Flavisphingomonas formosensis TaxID=861534 RepID=UPI0012FC209E|nr:aromatic amino acid ammonia-lyase [Sphingomonas formosensis]
MFRFLLTPVLAIVACAFALSPAAAAAADPPPYHAITPSMAGKTVVLTGHDLTLDQVIAVARYGSKVQVTPEAKQRMKDNYGLLLEGSTEGVSIYWFNRGAGGARETVMFAGNPESPENYPKVADTQMRAFRGGASGGYGPEIADEELVRAIMVIRANAMTWNAPSPGLAQMLVDLINHRVTPVVNSRGTVGEGDLAALSNVGATMVGAGDAYLDGVRMPAAEALAKAGLKPIIPFAADNNALTSSNAYATAQAALLVYDAQAMLEWADMAYAFDLNGMNSSVTPLSLAVQADRPDPWLNWHAGKIKEMIKGSYLFGADPQRIIQDPESLRASSIRQASAWKAWSRLRDSVLFQMNTSDHNPVVKVGLKPEDSWELATPQMMRYYVKGGPQSGGKSGYIFSNANWDPYPLANEVEAFSLAVANMDVAIVHRLQRFSNPFFTVVKAADYLPKGAGYGGSGGYTPVDLWQEIQSLAVPIAAEGNSMGDGVEELQAQTRLKTARARQLVETTLSLIGFDLNNGARWIDVRKAQDPARSFGPGVDAAWAAYRKVVPLVGDAPGGLPQNQNAAQIMEFLKGTRATSFFPGPAMPPGEPVALVRW